MNRSVSYACDDEEMYENASATPLATCTINATSVALPKTYHHFESCGAICFIGDRRTLMPNRSSSQFHTVLNSLITARWKSERSPASFALRHLRPAHHSEREASAADRPQRCRRSEERRVGKECRS